MKIGMNIRNWGDLATRPSLLACARAADAAGVDSIWVNDHIGFPPKIESNEFSLPDDFGNILDPLGALAFLSACTERVSIGSAVLLLPYRPPLLTAKWIATIQELSGDRLLLGVGAGWMAEEFRALGIDRKQRGRLTDDTLVFLRDCFARELIEPNGQPLLFRPRPKRPPIYVGGSPGPAIPRAVRFAEGWMPVGVEPGDLKPLVQQFHEAGRQAGRGELEVVAMKTLPLEREDEAVDYARAFRDAGATHLVHTQGFGGPDEYRAVAEQLAQTIRPAVASGGSATER